MKCSRISPAGMLKPLPTWARASWGKYQLSLRTPGHGRLHSARLRNLFISDPEAGHADSPAFHPQPSPSLSLSPSVLLFFFFSRSTSFSDIQAVLHSGSCPALQDLCNVYRFHGGFILFTLSSKVVIRYFIWNHLAWSQSGVGSRSLANQIWHFTLRSSFLFWLEALLTQQEHPVQGASYKVQIVN